MAMANSMKNLADQIVISHNARVKALGDLALDVKRTLNDFAEERHDAGVSNAKTCWISRMACPKAWRIC